jgi:hypothetical protein
LRFGFRVLGLGFWVWEFGFGVLSLGFGVWGRGKDRVGACAAAGVRQALLWVHVEHRAQVNLGRHLTSPGLAGWGLGLQAWI